MFLNDRDPDDSMSYYLSRSRSSHDMTEDQDNPEMQGFIYEQRKTFFRQRAVRKRGIEWHDSKVRRSAISLIAKEEIDEDCHCKDFPLEGLMEVNRVSQKYHKNSMILSVVKDIWKSMRSDIKNNEQAIENQKKLSFCDTNSQRKSKPCEDRVPNVTNLINKVVRSVVVNRRPVEWISESSWTDIVETNMDSTKQNCDLQAAIWELIETEASCLNFLSMIVEAFQPVFCKLRMRFTELEGIEEFQLFGNIDEVYKSHLQLWETCISLPLLKSRMDHEPLDILLMKDGFLSIWSIMESYKTFIQVQGSMGKRFQELEKSNSIFKEYITWTRSYSKLYRNGIQSILFVPFQRITKYKLLLERIRCFTTEKQNKDLNEMISAVHEFLNYINSIVNKDLRLEEIKSKLVIKALTAFDSIEVLKIQQDKSFVFDITRSSSGLPERVLVHEGQLKLKSNQNKRIDVHCYLFNDLFLICKPIRKDWNKLTIFKSPIRIDKFMIKEESEGAFLALIFNDFASVEYFIEFLGETDEIKLWIEKCNKTRELFQNQFATALKITDTFFLPSLDTKFPIDQTQFPENFERHRVPTAQSSEVSVSGYSTGSADSFSSQCLDETLNESCDSKPISEESLLSDTSLEDSSRFQAEYNEVNA